MNHTLIIVFLFFFSLVCPSIITVLYCEYYSLVGWSPGSLWSRDLRCGHVPCRRGFLLIFTGSACFSCGFWRTRCGWYILFFCAPPCSFVSLLSVGSDGVSWVFLRCTLLRRYVSPSGDSTVYDLSTKRLVTVAFLHSLSPKRNGFMRTTSPSDSADMLLASQL